MECFLSVLLDVFRWSSLTNTEKTETRVTWLVVLSMIVGVGVTVALS